MTEKTLTLEEAEAQLLALEKPGHDVALANSALRRAEQDGNTDAIKAALEKYRAAVEAQDKANVRPIDIARAAQLVLDLRGEAHSELNVLPSDHGLRTVLANRALALALGDGNAAQIDHARKDLELAIAEDEADKAAHVAESHARTLAAAEEGEK